VLPGVVAGALAGTLALASLRDGTASPMAAGMSVSFVDGSDYAGSVDAAVLAEVDAAAGSLVKQLVVARLMQLDAGGALDLTARDVGLMEAAVTSSDDDAMSTLWWSTTATGS
jgi:hypothetical protein